MSELSWRDAVTEVLAAVEEPLHHTEIAEQVIALGLRKSVGATPAATVGALLSTAIKNEGGSSPFEKVAPGTYRLRPSAMAALPAAARERAQAKGSPEEPESQAGLINAFGMFWDREKVLWESSRPRLLGVQHGATTQVDFTGQRGVYLLYDRREVVYVGRTSAQDLGTRVRDHTTTTSRLNGRWDRFSWFGILPVQEDGTLAESPSEGYTTDVLIATMEALLIEGLEPRQNRKRGDNFNAFEFTQVLDPEIERRQQQALFEKLKQKL